MGPWASSSWVPRLLSGHPRLREGARDTVRGDAKNGQTAAEYMGALMIVGAITLVILTAGVPEAVAGGVRQAICTIEAGTDCGEPTARRRLRRRRVSRLGLGDREIYDDNCGATPDDPAREGDDGAVGNEQVDEAYANLGRVYDYYHDKFG